MPDLDSFLHKGHLLLQHKKPQEAEKQAAYVISADPNNTRALSLLARCKYEQRKFQEGLDDITRAISIDPGEDYFFYLLAFGNYQLSRLTTAIESLQTAIRINPYVADYFGLLSLIYLEQKNFSKALEPADAGLAINPENISCLNARSTALNKLKRMDLAMETMQFALQQDPENDYTHLNIGWNMLEKGNNKEATVHFKEALRINPMLEGARVGLKESLKSRILPYKWLLQYSFWINNKGKRARWAIPLGIYFLSRLLYAGAGSSLNGFGIAGGMIIGLYFLLVATSWIINPLANFFLLFNRDGKYALTQNEKLNSLLLIGSMFLAIILFGGSVWHNSRYGNAGGLDMLSLITLSLALPLGHMKFPLSLSNNSKLQWYAMVLVIAGLTAGVLVILSVGFVSGALLVYALGFVAYTWLHAFLPH